mgnify:CR=1 FL=1
MKPITLTKSELEQVLNRVNRGRKRLYAAGRVCFALAHRHSIRTGELNRNCELVNISDRVRRVINPRIADLGLFVACTRPITPFKNSFNQDTGQVEWSFYRTPEAANDACYDPVEGGSNTSDSGMMG